MGTLYGGAGEPGSGAPATWLERLYSLAVRFPQLGIGPDLGALPVADLWGLYRFLNRLSGGG